MRGHLHAAMATVPTPEPEKATPEIDYVRWLMQMQTDFSSSLNGIMLRGARPVPIGAASGGTLLPTTSAGRLVGWSIQEAAGTPANAGVRFYNGRNSADGSLIGVARLAAAPSASSSNTTWLGTGVSITDGLWVEITGTVEGVVWLGAAE